MYYRIGICALVILGLIGCGNLGVNVTRGSGNVKTETRDVSNFHQVALAGFGDLNITQGDSEGLTIEAEDNLLPFITTNVQDGTLTIGVKPGINALSVVPTKQVKYELQVKNLDAVQLSGAGNITAPTLKSENLTLGTSGAGNLNFPQIATQKLSTTLSGAGGLAVGGQAQTQDVALSGFGNYNAGDLQTASTSVNLTGAGNATVWASETLNAQISGAGNISYYGSPQVTQKVSGVGTIKSLGNK